MCLLHLVEPHPLPLDTLGASVVSTPVSPCPPCEPESAFLVTAWPCAEGQPPARGPDQVRAGGQRVAPSPVACGLSTVGHDPHCSRAAWIDKCRPNLLITESTYATTIRDSKRCRERDFLKKVHETVERGGKVAGAVGASGRAPGRGHRGREGRPPRGRKALSGLPGALVCPQVSDPNRGWPGHPLGSLLDRSWLGAGVGGAPSSPGTRP